MSTIKTTLRLFAALLITLFAITRLGAQTPRPHVVTIKWVHPDNTAKFNLYRADKDCNLVVPADWKVIATDIAALSYDNTNVMAGKYCYTVTTVKLGQESAKAVPVGPTVLDIDSPTGVTYIIDLTLTGRLTITPAPNGVQKASVNVPISISIPVGN